MNTQLIKPAEFCGPLYPSIEHALRLTFESNVRFEYPEYIFYPPGHFDLMKQFFNQLWLVEASFKTFQFIYQEPQIHFDMYSDQGELRLWKSVDGLRKRVNETCRCCGRFAKKQCFKGSIIIYCPECIEALKAASLEPDFWLDNYR